MTARSERRATFDDSTRIALLEDDVDSIEKTGQRLAQAVEQGKQSMNRLLIAIVSGSLALVAMSLLLAVDIARGH